MGKRDLLVRLLRSCPFQFRESTMACLGNFFHIFFCLVCVSSVVSRMACNKFELLVYLVGVVNFQYWSSLATMDNSFYIPRIDVCAKSTTFIEAHGAGICFDVEQ